MRKPKKSDHVERVFQIIDHIALDNLLKETSFPPQKFALAHDRVDTLIIAVRTMEADIGVSADDRLNQKPAQKPVNTFKKSARLLMDLADQLDMIEAPRRRHMTDPTSLFYVPEVGADQLQNALSDTLAKILVPTFLSPFGINVSDFYKVQTLDSDSRPLREQHGRPRNIVTFDEISLKSALAPQAIATTTAIMQQLSLALSNAAESLKPEEKRGGAAPNPLQDLILLNIIKLWDEGFNGAKAIYIDEVYRDLFDFTKNICISLGVPSYCTEYKLKITISYWKKRSGRKLP